MSIVTPGMLTATRHFGNQMLTSLATISRPSTVETPFGSERAFAPVATDVPCWVRSTSLTPGITDVAYREAVVGSFRIHFEVGTDVRPGDHLDIDGATYEVNDSNIENTIKVFTTALAKKVE